MKPRLYQLPFPLDSSYLYHKMECSYFDIPWHFHKEYELVLINKSYGTKCIGNKVSPFNEGDLSLIGANVPHLFKNDEEYHSNSGNLEASSIFIHFTKDFLGDVFFDLPEMKLVQQLLNRSSLAFEVHGNTKKYAITRLNDMYEQLPPQRLLSLLDILIRLSQSSELKPLLSYTFAENNSGDTEKINNVFEFIMKNYTEEIYVKEIASKLNMSIASFSRYFKQHTRKTFSDYVTEIRIGHVCKLLMEDNYSISEISYKSGFDNLSNFYRHFRKITGMIPKEYRDTFLKISSR